MHKTILFAALIAGLIVPRMAAADPAAPGDTAVPATAVNTVTDSTALDPDTMVCRDEAPVVGTRLGSKRQCTTLREWNRIRRDSQTLTANTQVHTYSESKGP